jgi:hypothetical protein
VTSQVGSVQRALNHISEEGLVYLGTGDIGLYKGGDGTVGGQLGGSQVLQFSTECA